MNLLCGVAHHLKGLAGHVVVNVGDHSNRVGAEDAQADVVEAAVSADAFATATAVVEAELLLAGGQVGNDAVLLALPCGNVGKLECLVGHEHTQAFNLSVVVGDGLRVVARRTATVHEILVGLCLHHVEVLAGGQVVALLKLALAQRDVARAVVLNPACREVAVGVRYPPVAAGDSPSAVRAGIESEVAHERSHVNRVVEQELVESLSDILILQEARNGVGVVDVEHCVVARADD